MAAEFPNTFCLANQKKPENFCVQLSHAHARFCDATVCIYDGVEASEVPEKYIQFIVVIRLAVSVSKQVNSRQVIPPT